MNETSSPPIALSGRRNSWPRAAAVVGVFAVLAAAAVIIAREVIHAPAAVLHETSGLVGESARALRTVAQGFQEGIVRTEFISHAAELNGASRFQFATLKQGEVFKREESGTTAWGLVPLPKIVVEAQAPVEYSYYIDFNEAWRFERTDDRVVVFTPQIMANTPALDVSALTFYTLEGSVWRDDQPVREKLRQSLSAALLGRAIENRKLVREIGRQRVVDFVEKWLVERFSDGKHTHVKVVFPDEVDPPAERRRQ